MENKIIDFREIKKIIILKQNTIQEIKMDIMEKDIKEDKTENEIMEKTIKIHLKPNKNSKIM